MAESQKRRVWFVYGNHGEAPVQIEDFVQYLGLYMESRGWTFCLTKIPVANELNILLECFDEHWKNLICSLKAESPKTKLVLLMSENAGGGSFNQFRDAIKEGTQTFPAGIRIPERIEECLPVGFSRSKFSRAWVARKFFRIVQSSRIDRYIFSSLKKFPKLFALLQRFYRARIKAYPPAILPYLVYHDAKYWNGRYQTFLQVAAIADHLACVSPDLRNGYVELFGESRVKVLSFGAVASRPLISQFSDREKDIDVFFSGTRTPHRTEMLERLERLGLKVLVAPPTTPSVIRENLLKRSKVCLHIRQDNAWRTLSIMRVHQIISSGNILLAERTPVVSKFSDLTTPFDSENIESVVLDQLEKGRFKDRGEELLARYNRELPADDGFHLSLVRLLESGKPLSPATEIRVLDMQVSG